MADFTNIKAEIDAKIVPDNHAQLITGKRLNDTLQDLVDAVDEKKQDTLTETQNANINAVPNKVDKVTGKGLSTNDYTTAEKNKLAGLENYDDAAIKGRVSAIEGKEAGWDAKYSKPNTGIPATDLASGVQTTLGKVTELEQNVGNLQDDVNENSENIEAIKANIDELGDIHAKSIDLDELPKVCHYEMFIIRDYAPDVAPDFIPQFWIDKAAGKVYIATATTNASSFKALN